MALSKSQLNRITKKYIKSYVTNIYQSASILLHMKAAAQDVGEKELMPPTIVKKTRTKPNAKRRPKPKHRRS